MKKILILFLALLAGGLLWLGSRDWDSPELGRALLREVGKASGVEMTAEGFHLNLLRGVVLENVDARSSRDGEDLTIEADRLLFEHRLLPLLSGTVAVDRILLEEPRFELRRSSEEGASPEPAPEESSGVGPGFVLELRQILVSDGSLSIRNARGEEKTRVEGLDLEMEDVSFDPSASSLAGLSGRGTFEIREVRFDVQKLTGVEGNFEVREARVTVPELTFSTPHGSFVADAEVDFEPVPFRYQLNARGDPLDLNAMMGAREEGFGRVSMTLDAAGAGPETKGLRAQGRIHIEEGRFPEAPMFTRIDRALGKRAVVRSPYQETEASFELANGRVTLLPFRFLSGDLRIDLEGQVSLEGAIDLDLAIATPREGLRIEGVGATVLEALADEEDWVPIPMDAGGTLQDPIVLPDVKLLASQAARGAGRELVESAKDALRDLLKKKKNE